ncbi:MAG: serine/threonine protein phosphatase [Rhodospirillaceae bacterium]|nr:serine/threonine protein phosphatase [Rhodospirillaceae bacterium]MBT5513433.1 serine/threonine protein phosphatase [Rhodospirillaceae bacterium]MBT6882996.1 serine/threonine protein phosphatase [Rhodospirillaceae bacterium]MBT7512131.1 serine/threonine protein phosphatase [Rhodospirillaceae bacterium]
MAKDLGQHQFTYAVITDTHVNFGETECNSEFEINKRANGRMRHVIGDLNNRDLAFVIHLGDIVHPVPALPDLYEMAADCFREEIAQLRHPLHLVPGNHDIGDKPITWGPGGVECDEYIKLWKKNFGAVYHAFDHQDCRFIQIDSQLINSGLTAEDEQKAWLEGEMAEATKAGKRIFINTHYPLYLTDFDEDEHFDNLAQPGRSWLLDLMERHGVEAQFSGHVHNFWYNRYGVTDCYALPSTAFVRQDYAEMYRAAPLPGTEGGRSDLAKLGYFVVQVFEHGHFCEWIRTFGTVAEPGSPDDVQVDCVAPVHPLQNRNPRFGFDMRQNWLEVIEIPPSGSLDEFDRKRTRNDYILMALIETGAARVRIPASDILDPGHRARLDECARHGFHFTLFSFGVPDARLLAAVKGAEGLVDIWEICDTDASLPAVADAASPVAKAAGISLYLSRVRTREDQVGAGGKYHHMIVHGFTPDDHDYIARAAEIGGIEGLVFRIEGGTSPWRAASDATKALQGTGLKASLHIRMTLGPPGLKQTDDNWVAERAAEAISAAAAFEDIHVYADTFADVDRGYYRRHGVVDRFCNPRPAFDVVRHLNGALASGHPFAPDGESQTVSLIGADGRRFDLLKGAEAPSGMSESQPGVLIDLGTGECVAIENGPGAPRKSGSGLRLWARDA